MNEGEADDSDSRTVKEGLNRKNESGERQERSQSVSCPIANPTRSTHPVNSILIRIRRDQILIKRMTRIKSEIRVTPAHSNRRGIRVGVGLVEPVVGRGYMGFVGPADICQVLSIGRKCR